MDMSVPDGPLPDAAPRRFQFGLIELTETVAGVAIGVALVTEFGGFGACTAAAALAILLPFLYVAHAPSRQHAREQLTRVATRCAGALMLLCLLSSFFPAIGSGPPSL